MMQHSHHVTAIYTAAWQLPPSSAPLCPSWCPAAPAATACHVHGRPQSASRPWISRTNSGSRCLEDRGREAQGCAVCLQACLPPSASMHAAAPSAGQAAAGRSRRQPPRQIPRQAHLVEVCAEQDDGGGEAHQRRQAQDHLVEHSLAGWAGEGASNAAWTGRQAGRQLDLRKWAGGSRRLQAVQHAQRHCQRRRARTMCPDQLAGRRSWYCHHSCVGQNTKSAAVPTCAGGTCAK